MYLLRRRMVPQYINWAVCSIMVGSCEWVYLYSVSFSQRREVCHFKITRDLDLEVFGSDSTLQ
jgi:hypothetical protein